MNRTGITAGVAAIAAMFSSCGAFDVDTRVEASSTPASAVETGVHWAAAEDFAQLKKLGFQFAVVSLDRNPENWKRVFDSAEANGIRLVAGLHPYPFWFEGGEWKIDSAGRKFIEYAAARKHLVKALFGLNEPQWVDPATGANTPCGAITAASLRALRVEVRKLWPQALLYHDLGRPSLWSPGGAMARTNACVGGRYADVTEIADFAGVWYYPVNARDGYRREDLVNAIREEVAFVTSEMHAEPVVLGQAFRCKGCSDGTRLPTRDEVRDLNCTLRWIAPQAISWYSWRHPTHSDSLGQHENLWEAAGPRGCPDGRG